jgi:hypothetical protein
LDQPAQQPWSALHLFAGWMVDGDFGSISHGTHYGNLTHLAEW